jgi:hypothetical protein
MNGNLKVLLKNGKRILALLIASPRNFLTLNRFMTIPIPVYITCYSCSSTCLVPSIACSLITDHRFWASALYILDAGVPYD